MDNNIFDAIGVISILKKENMKKLIFILICINLSWSVSAQEDYSEDVASMDNILATLYEVISGDKGVERDWDRFRNLFTDDAKLIPIGKDQSGKIGISPITPEGYVERAGDYLVKNGFHEKEIARKVEQYGPLAHVWSTYESYRSKMDSEPFARGINSIQLLDAGDRWYVVQIYWLGESDEYPLPAKYEARKD